MEEGLYKKIKNFIEDERNFGFICESFESSEVTKDYIAIKINGHNLIPYDFEKCFNDVFPNNTCILHDLPDKDYNVSYRLTCFFKFNCQKLEDFANLFLKKDVKVIPLLGNTVFNLLHLNRLTNDEYIAIHEEFPKARVVITYGNIYTISISSSNPTIRPDGDYEIQLLYDQIYRFFYEDLKDSILSMDSFDECVISEKFISVNAHLNNYDKKISDKFDEKFPDNCTETKISDNGITFSIYFKTKIKNV